MHYGMNMHRSHEMSLICMRWVWWICYECNV